MFFLVDSRCWVVTHPFIYSEFLLFSVSVGAPVWLPLILRVFLFNQELDFRAVYYV